MQNNIIENIRNCGQSLIDNAVNIKTYKEELYEKFIFKT